jgi:O-antigen/teichoic acid export membrane protein
MRSLKNLPQGVWAICDQSAVSAANFLTIALGAWMLPLPEQAKLVYVYSAYMALVLFNAAALFSAAPTLRHEVPDIRKYQQQLLCAQVLIALGGSILAALLLWVLGRWLDWVPNALELLGGAGFLITQQMADFNRRSRYVFGRIESGVLYSTMLLLLRVGLLLMVRPDNAGLFYLILLLSSVPGAWAAFGGERNAIDSSTDKDIGRRHRRLSSWNVATAPMIWVGQHLPIFLAGALVGGGAAAILASVRSVSTVANVLLELLETYVPSRLAASLHRDGAPGFKSVMRRLYLLGAGVWLLGLIVILFYGKEILGLALGPAYMEHAQILVLFWVGNGLYFIGRSTGVRYRMVRRPVVEFVGSVVGVLVMLACVPLMVWYGVYGVAWALVLVRLSAAGVQLLYGRYLLGSAY